MTLIDRLPTLLKKDPNVRLIIIDSLAALFRSEDIMFQHQVKAKTLQYFGFAMHTLCHRYNIAIICINQVPKQYNLHDFVLLMIIYLIFSQLLGSNQHCTNSKFFVFIESDYIRASTWFDLGVPCSLSYSFNSNRKNRGTSFRFSTVTNRFRWTKF